MTNAPINKLANSPRANVPQVSKNGVPATNFNSRAMVNILIEKKIAKKKMLYLTDHSKNNLF